ncbi:MAG: alpha/beta hydrolase [Planctomycetota bacterium]
MSKAATSPLILFSGLAADANIFVHQKTEFPELIVPEWPIPTSDESLEEYAARLAGQLRSRNPCVIGGASFGGIVAQHVAHHLQPLAVVLIGSVRAPSELPVCARMARPMRFLVPIIPVRLLQCLIRPLTTRFARNLTPHLSGLAKQFCTCHPQVFKWSLLRILDWRSVPTFACPVFHVHGDRDYVLPSKRTQPDRLIHGGGHVISLTHPAEVNESIRDVLNQLSDASVTHAVDES